MRVAFVVAALSLAVLAGGCGGHHAGAAPLRPCAVGLVSPLPYTHDLLAPMPDGSFVVGTTYENSGTVSVVLQRVDSRCHLMRSWAGNGTAIIGLPVIVGEFGYVGGSADIIAAGRGGRVLIGGDIGHHELVGQLLPDGKLDRSFGHRGWARVTVREPHLRGLPAPSPTAISFALSQDGAIFVGGSDGGAHCCARSFVTELTATGQVVSGFGGSGSVLVPHFAGSYVTELAPNRDGSVYAFVEYEQSGSSSPEVIRLRRDGSLDRRFDSTIARTIRRATPKDYRFTPTLVPGPDGTFELLGGLDKEWPPLSSNGRSGGAGLQVMATGSGAGTSTFPSPNDAFDNPVAIRLPSGGVAAAGLLYDDRGGVKSVIVRTFSSDGSPLGAHTVPRSVLSGAFELDGLVPARDGGVWLVMNSRRNVELIPVH